MEEKLRQLIKDSTLCANNLQVKFYLNNMKKRLKALNIKDEELTTLINDSLEVLRIMKKMGQHMEDRLRLLKSHIEACGFQRIKRKKK